MPDFLNLFKTRQLLELPLVVEYQAITTRPPSVKILLPTNIGGAGVQNSSLATLDSSFGGTPEHEFVDATQPIRLLVSVAPAKEVLERTRANTGVSAVDYHAQILGDDRRSSAVFQFQVRGDCHENLLAVRRHAVQQRGVVERAVPGGFESSPRDNTDESLSSSSGSGVLRIRPTTSSRTSFQRSSWACSWTIVIRIRRWIPWCRRNNPRQGRSSLWSTTEGTYSPLGASSQISNQTRTSYFA
ncbi:Protein of unknown function [Cotesia congregata]|uniref:Uncharacterized protein n=1 Tax=Cotesia congregata TaxID=51543 RepID=A0A8J2HB64_COTCN|nr:Protein of unknown function [Cotesia congregata]